MRCCTKLAISIAANQSGGRLRDTIQRELSQNGGDGSTGVQKGLGFDAHSTKFPLLAEQKIDDAGSEN